MRRAVLSVVVVAAAVRADVTHAAIDDRDPAPLLVVLHGNHETASTRAAKWRDAARKRGWHVLALDCPRDEGCDDVGRWYAWNGHPSWLHTRVREHTERVAVDAARIYLAGWSGGATYIGKRMPAWAPMFSGVVIHGGGVPPRADGCPDRPLPTYFLVGDKNPGHGGARRLRDYVRACGQELVWDLLAGANHAGEDAALTPAKAEEILRWLERGPIQVSQAAP